MAWRSRHGRRNEATGNRHGGPEPYGRGGDPRRVMQGYVYYLLIFGRSPAGVEARREASEIGRSPTTACDQQKLIEIEYKNKNKFEFENGAKMI